MPSSRSVHGRSREYVVRSKRSHAELKSSRSGEKKSSKAREEVRTYKPDVDELRNLRSAYFSRPLVAGRRVTPVASGGRNYEIIEVYEPRARTSRSERSDKSRKSQKSSSDDSGQRSKRPRRAPDGDFVYPITPPPADYYVERVRDVPRETSSRRAPSTRQSSGQSHSQAQSSRRTRAPSLNLPDAEVTPDDSISQVAERNYQASRARYTPRRNDTARSRRLDPVEEVEVIESPRRVVSSPAYVPSRRPTTKRESQPSLLGTLFRRPSVNSAPSVQSPPAKLVECLTCGADDVPANRSAQLPCKHNWCFACLKRVFTMSVTDPAHMPPKCCTDKHIPLKHVDRLFDNKFKVLWNKRYQEYHTKNRLYCPVPKCGEWIKPSNIRTSMGKKYGQCPRCRTKVCTLCNNKLHRSRECPKDPEIARLVEQAKEKGWQRCYRCQALVELKEGCNHMTCRCMAEFCMICGAKWKTCDCAWFNYTQLPDADRLNDMRVPEPVQVLFRQVFAGAPNNDGIPPLPRARPPPAAENRRQRTYLEEIEGRRRQERLDAELARRVQLAMVMDDENDAPARRRARAETFGLGNAAGHFMNDNYVLDNNPRDAVVEALLDDGRASYGRRGERAAGRRRPQRQSRENNIGQDPGLAPNFLGDESVVGLPPGAFPR